MNCYDLGGILPGISFFVQSVYEIRLQASRSAPNESTLFVQFVQKSLTPV